MHLKRIEGVKRELFYLVSYMYSGQKKEKKGKLSTIPRGNFQNMKPMRFCKCSPLFLSVPSVHLTGHNTAQYSLQYNYVLAEKSLIRLLLPFQNLAWRLMIEQHHLVIKLGTGTAVSLVLTTASSTHTPVMSFRATA